MRNTEIETLRNLTMGEKMPDLHIVENGVFPETWVSEYLQWLIDNRLYWQNVERWPREMTYYFYRIALHMGEAYNQWCRDSGEKNNKTEADLAKVRLFTEAFIHGDSSLKWDIES